MYAVTRSCRQQRPAAPRCRRTPCRATPIRRTSSPSSSKRVTIPVDGDHPPRASSRRCSLPAPARAGRHRRVRLSSTARHDLGVTQADVPVTGLPPRARGPAHRPAHRRPPQPLGVPRGRRPRRRRCSTAERPDLIVLGGDYVTWGDRRYVDAGGRGARAAVGAARRVRHPRQPRRRPRHAGRARRARRADAEGRPHRSLTINGEADRPRRHPVLDQTRRRTSPRVAEAAPAARSSCSRTIRDASPKPPR